MSEDNDKAQVGILNKVDSKRNKVLRFSVWEDTKIFSRRFLEVSILEQRVQLRFLSNVIRKQMIEVEKAKFKEKMKSIKG